MSSMPISKRSGCFQSLTVVSSELDLLGDKHDAADKVPYILVIRWLWYLVPTTPFI